jgi:hypothetical protein
VAGFKGDLVTITIPAGGGTSNVIDLKQATLLRLYMPSAWTAAAITIEEAPSSSGPWGVLFDDEGTQITITTSASRTIRFDERLFQHANYLRFGSSVNQAAARDVIAQRMPTTELASPQL